MSGREDTPKYVILAGFCSAGLIFARSICQLGTPLVKPEPKRAENSVGRSGSPDRIFYGSITYASNFHA